MSKDNRYSPAHPVTAGNQVYAIGVTKRELASFMAMQGMLASETNEAGGCYLAENAAVRSVQFADALIAELDKNGPAPTDIASGEIGGRE